MPHPAAAFGGNGAPRFDPSLIPATAHERIVWRARRSDLRALRRTCRSFRAAVDGHVTHLTVAVRSTAAATTASPEEGQGSADAPAHLVGCQESAGWDLVRGARAFPNLRSLTLKCSSAVPDATLACCLAQAIDQGKMLP